MRAKFVNESLNEKTGNPSLFILEYTRTLNHDIPNFGGQTLKQMFGPGSDWYGDAKYYAYSDDEDYSNWSKDDAALEVKFFENLIKQGKGDWGTWDGHSEEEEFGNDEDYWQVERDILEKGNFDQLTPTLFYDEKAKTGYIIEEYQSFASPEYNIWFFEIGGAKYNRPNITEREFMDNWFKDPKYVLAAIGDKKYGIYNVNLAREDTWGLKYTGDVPYCGVVYNPKTSELTIQNKVESTTGSKPGYYGRKQTPSGKKVTLKTDNLEEITSAIYKYLEENPLPSRSKK